MYDERIRIFYNLKKFLIVSESELFMMTLLNDFKMVQEHLGNRLSAIALTLVLSLRVLKKKKN